MTEREAIEELKYDCNELGKAIPCDTSWGSSFENAYGMAIQALEKLAEYEDLEKHGRLIKLPCKVGDIVYVNGVLGCGVAEKYKVIKVNYYSTLGTRRNEFCIEALLNDDPRNSIAFYDKELGKTVFLTKKEAETKLEEIRSVEDV